MIILIGPQTTDEEEGDLAEAAGLYGAVRMHSPGVDWAEVEAFHCLPGWEKCPIATADVQAARSFGLPIEQLNT
ncbi:hypothetical protein ACWDX6_23915 [Streptomyces sp. NPDC003027]